VTAPTLLQIVPTLAGGGLARATLDAAQAVVGAGGQAIVASPGGAMVPDLLRLRATHLELPEARSRIMARLGQPPRLALSLRTSGIGVVQSRSALTGWIARSLSRPLHAKWVAVLHQPFAGHGAFDRFIEGRQARADAVVAVSDHVARDTLARFPNLASKLTVIPPGVNFDRFDPALVRADRVIRLASELRVPDGSHLILCPARFDVDRGQKLLIEAVKLLARPDAFCLLLGSTGAPTPFEKELEHAITAANLQGRVQIGPYSDDMPAAYMLADVVVATGGPKQGFSRTLIEAAAMGRPTVAEDGGGAAETIRAGVTGWLTEAGSAKSLAEGLANALDLNAERRAELARAAQEHVRARYSLAEASKKLLDLYSGLLPQA
jgi:glycosyltransferase involved in cell wall biosynthesis